MDTGSLLTESGKPGRIKETPVAKRIEQQLSETPATVFLAFAAGALALSLGLATARRSKNWANFVGQWVPTILLLGVYDKMLRSTDKDTSSKSSLLH